MKHSNSLSITVILPIINEFESLKKTIDILIDENYEHISKVIFVLSKTKTLKKSLEMCKEYNKKNPSKYEILFQKLPYLGGAIRDGFDRVKTSHCLMMSSDLETDPYSVKFMINQSINNPNSIITATRWNDKNLFSNYGLIKKILNFIFQKIFKFLYKTDLSDLTFGFRLFPTEIVQNIKWEMLDHSFLLETILKPLKLKVNVIEVSSTWSKRTEGFSSNNFIYYFKYFYIGFKTLIYR